MPAVSVIIPTYKHRDFVLATLDSVFTQTFTDYEVIVINDGSPDDTAEVLKPLAESGRIRYIEQENQGQGAARNRGIAEAQGEFIALLDDDDLWPPDKLEWQVKALVSQPEAGMVAGTADVTNSAGLHITTSPFIPEIYFETLFLGNPINSPGQTLIRANILRQINGFNAQIWGADDWDLWFRIAKISLIIMKNRVGLVYRVHANNASNQIKRMVDNCCLVVDLHLPNLDTDKRSRAKLSAYQALYDYIGRQLLNKMKTAVRAGKFGPLASDMRSFAKLSKVLIGDAASAKIILRDFIPDPLLRQISRIKYSDSKGA